jgi:curved DNA-binding protein
MATDYYAELGIDRGASEDAIKKAYRKLASQYHPDKNPGNARAESRFKSINQAYQVLSDAKRRALYDEFGDQGLREGFNAEAARHYGVGGRTPFSGGVPGGFNVNGVNIEDLFGGGGGFSGFVGDLFNGARRGKRRAGKGADIASEVTVDLPTALRGTTVQVQLQGNAAPVTVRIPPGAEDGDRVRVPGQGAPGGGAGGGASGDLIIRIHVRPHEHFERNGLDLYLDLPITIREAYEGAKVSVPTPGGEVTLKVPEGAQSGQVVRLKGRGVKRKDKQGDLFVRFLVKMPVRRSKAVQEAVAVLEGASEANVRANIRL